MNSATTWTNERVDALVALFDAGESAGDIALRLNRDFPQLAFLSRSAVCGKVKRLRDAGDVRLRPADPVAAARQGGIAAKCARTKTDRRTRSSGSGGRVVFAPHPAPDPPVAPQPQRNAGPAPEPLEVGLLDLQSHHCRAVTGKGEDGLATYCGHAAKRPFGYCAHHAARFHTSASEAERLKKIERALRGEGARPGPKASVMKVRVGA